VAARASAVIAALHPPPAQPPHSDERTTAATELASCWQLDDQAEESLTDVFPVDWFVAHHDATAPETAPETAAVQLWREHWRGRQETVSDACYAIAQAWQSDHAPSGRSSSGGEVGSGVGVGVGVGGGLREAIRWYERAIAVAEAASERPVLPQLQALSATAEASSGNGKGKATQPQAATAAATAAAGEGDADYDDEAIEPGHAEALYQLGCIFLYGDTAQGIPQQLRPARCLLEASARCGHEEARQLIRLSSAVATR
jgi:hypothetical protein